MKAKTAQMRPASMAPCPQAVSAMTTILQLSGPSGDACWGKFFPTCGR
jgi:hypothetical protein